jgi:ergothioneine biosynthesis protein EgtB
VTTAADRFRAQFRDAWERSDRLFSYLKPDALLERPISLRHPFAFYLGHLPAFAWNQIGRGVLRRRAVHAAYDRLFERGIDPADEREAATSARSAWPAEGEIVAYRDAVRLAILDAVDAVLALPPGDPLAERGRVLRLVLEHEWMHGETLLYLIQALDHEKKRPPAEFVPSGGPAASLTTSVRVPAGATILGADFDAVEFGWDNEFPATSVDVSAFAIDSLPVTNEAFLHFVDAGGYRRDELWSAESAVWRLASGMAHPHAWRRDDDRWFVRAAFADVPFEFARAWPAQVSWAEADAYARWRGRRLPTEAQLQRAAYGNPAAAASARSHPWGDAPMSSRTANAALVQWAPEPVGRRPAGASAFGVEEIVGNGWEWTSTPFQGLPGFRAWARTYPGYSADFFDGRHFVMLGASWATDAGLVRRSFRNWFQPHYPYVFSKFRTVGPA